MINETDVTFVVQGPIHTPSNSRFGLTTEQVLKSIRAHFPNSTILLSTWKNSPLDGLDYDTLIESNDPGSCPVKKGAAQPFPSNVNRLIVSSRNGIDCVVTKYVCKTRTDVLFYSSSILHIRRNYKRMEENTFFRERVIVSRFFNRNPRTCSAYCFHYGDIFLFGLTNDLQKIFRVPLASPDSLYPYFNESYIWSHCFNIQSQSMSQCDQVQYTEKLLANEFVIYSENQLGIFLTFKKEPFHFKWCNRVTTYSHFSWWLLYCVKIRGKKYLKFLTSCLLSICWLENYIYHFGEYVYKMKKT